MNYTAEERYNMNRLASEIMTEIYRQDNTGRLLYLFCRKLCAISKLRAYGIDNKYKFVVITEDEYEQLKQGF